MGGMQKSRIFYGNWLYQEKIPFEENTTHKKANRCSVDKGCDLSIEMLRYNLTEIILTNLRNPFY